MFTLNWSANAQVHPDEDVDQLERSITASKLSLETEKEALDRFKAAEDAQLGNAASQHAQHHHTTQHNTSAHINMLTNARARNKPTHPFK